MFQHPFNSFVINFCGLHEPFYFGTGKNGSRTYVVEGEVCAIDKDLFFKKMKDLRYLHDMGCVIQADTRCFLEGFCDKLFAFKALKEGYIDVIASDCHDTVKRPPDLAQAYAAIRKKAGEEAIAHLQENARLLLSPSVH